MINHESNFVKATFMAFKVKNIIVNNYRPITLMTF